MSRLPEPGETWNDRYEITAELGRGGFGRVYRARDLLLERDVAIKMLRLSHDFSPTDQQRFRRETNIAASLDHRHIVTVYDGGERDGMLFLVMRFVAGRDLRYELADGPLAPERAVSIVRQVGGALDYAHGKGLVHRDVKPGNVLCHAESDAVFLADFGISRRVDQTTDNSVTKGLAPATVAYAAPEQMRTDARVDGRADQYALGCVLFECLTGRKPFDGEIAAMITAHLHEAPPRATELRPELPAAWDDVISTAMAKDPADRFPACQQLARAAELALPPAVREAEQLTASVPSFTAPTAPVPQREPASTPPASAPATRRFDAPADGNGHPEATSPGAYADPQAVSMHDPGPDGTAQATRPGTPAAPPAGPTTDPQPDGAAPPPAVPAPSRRTSWRRPIATVVMVFAGAVLVGWLVWPAITTGVDDAGTATAEEGDAGEGSAVLDDAQRELLATVNVFDPADCRPSTATELRGQQVAVACESDEQAPTRVVFRRFASTEERDAALTDLAGAADTDGDCRTNDRALHAYRGADGSGRVLCAVADDIVGLSWTVADQPIMGSARIDDPTRADDLYAWWDTLVQRSDA